VSGDFNQDGIPDLVRGGSAPAQQVTLGLGNGDGAFQSSRATGTTTNRPANPAVADVNHDVHLDVVAMEIAGFMSAVTRSTTKLYGC
jgi:hypothetical protein